MAYKRVVLKISGEALSNGKENIDFSIVKKVAAQVAELVRMGIEVCVIIGGGNIWRGRQGKEMDRVTADHMGMLATVINSLAFQDTLESMGVPTRLQTAIEMRQIAEPFIRRKAMRHLEKGRVVIFACGTGNPYFTTDMAAALRAAEMEVDLILLAKNVDGIYDSDPKVNPDAVKYDEISLDEVLSKKLGVIDLTATIMCLENKMPLVIFGLEEENSIVNTMSGKFNGTYVTV